MFIFYLLSAALAVALLVLLVAFICFYRVFYSPKRKPLGPDEYEIPEGEIYEPYREEMVAWMKEIRAMPHEDVSVTSFDGLTLRGSLYEHERKGAIIEILFHGYQGYAERDLSGAVERCFRLERSALIVNQRASGTSDGSVITFGINERRDCLPWINFLIERYGKDVKIILSGISMGAATVVMAGGEELPPNVVCVLGDCGYSSAKEIIQKIVREMHLPVRLVYPFIKLGARIFGRFNLEETSPLEAAKRCRVPLILFHGDTDAFVPAEMSQKVYDACTAKKKLVFIKGAGHGLAFPLAKEEYLKALREFQEECGF